MPQRDGRRHAVRMAHSKIDRSGEVAWRALAAIMFANGTLAVVAPRFLVRRLGVDPSRQAGMLYVFRMFGIRTVFLAVDLVRLPDHRPRSLREGIVVHSTDASAAVVAGLLGQLPLRPALMVAGISTLNTILAVTGARAYGVPR